MRLELHEDSREGEGQYGAWLIAAVNPPVFMGRENLRNWTRVGTMNLIDRPSSALPRSVTAQCSDAPARAARWVDWFRLATCVLIGELP